MPFIRGRKPTEQTNPEAAQEQAAQPSSETQLPRVSGVNMEALQRIREFGEERDQLQASLDRDVELLHRAERRYTELQTQLADRDAQESKLREEQATIQWALLSVNKKAVELVAENNRLQDRLADRDALRRCPLHGKSKQFCADCATELERQTADAQAQAQVAAALELAKTWYDAEEQLVTDGTINVPVRYIEAAGKDRIMRNCADELRALIPPATHDALAARDARAKLEAIEQCAIEAGERSPEGVSSHTMLGDMWDERINTLRAALAAPSTAAKEKRSHE